MNGHDQGIGSFLILVEIQQEFIEVCPQMTNMLTHQV